MVCFGTHIPNGSANFEGPQPTRAPGAQNINSQMLLQLFSPRSCDVHVCFMNPWTLNTWPENGEVGENFEEGSKTNISGDIMFLVTVNNILLSDIQYPPHSKNVEVFLGNWGKGIGPFWHHLGRLTNIMICFPRGPQYSLATINPYNSYRSPSSVDVTMRDGLHYFIYRPIVTKFSMRYPRKQRWQILVVSDRK